MSTAKLVNDERGTFSFKAPSMRMKEDYDAILHLGDDIASLTLKNGTTQQIIGDGMQMCGLAFLVAKEGETADKVYDRASQNPDNPLPVEYAGIDPEKLDSSNALFGWFHCKYPGNY
ncbi:MAG: hypothetical protein V3V78_04135 [Candidatus Woesearchaeota archaeon]